MKISNSKSNNKLGIWMDHSSAHFIEFNEAITDTKTIESKFTNAVKEQSLNKSEHIMHNKEKHQQAEYYAQIGAVIKNYDSVVLFGPTDAKAELHNTLKSDHHFDKIKIEVQQADKMTDNQQHAFVKDYFETH